MKNSPHLIRPGSMVQGAGRQLLGPVVYVFAAVSGTGGRRFGQALLVENSIPQRVAGGSLGEPPTSTQGARSVVTPGGENSGMSHPRAPPLEHHGPKPPADPFLCTCWDSVSLRRVRTRRSGSPPETERCAQDADPPRRRIGYSDFIATAGLRLAARRAG